MKDNWIEVAPTEEVTIEATPIIEETPTTTEETPTIEFTDEQFAEILNSIEQWISETPSQDWEEVIRPTFEKEEEEDFIEEAVLEQLLNEFDTTKEELTIAQEKIVNFDIEKEEFNKKIQELEDTVNWVNQAYQRALEHPQLWEYFLQLAGWKEVNIPEIIKQNLEQWIKSLPKTEKTETIMIEIPKPKKQENEYKPSFSTINFNKIFDNPK